MEGKPRRDVFAINLLLILFIIAITLLEIEPRYPMFGGWRTAFTIGYGLPLQDYLFQSDGKRLLNISFGCPMNEVIVEKLIVKVILPEGSKDISVSIPFPVRQTEEVEELVAKERDLQQKLMLKHLTMVESFERKSGRRDGESRTISIQRNISVLQKISMLEQEVDELLDFIDEI